MNRRLRKFLLPALAATFGLALACLATELLLRVVDPIGLNYDREFQRYRNEALTFDWDGKDLATFDFEGRLFRHKPNLDLQLGSFRLRTNSLGFRGNAVSEQKPEGAFRVLVLGDSVAFGWGVDEAATFLRRFEAEWNTTNARQIEVVNAGHLVYDSVQEWALLRDQGLALQPDLVLLVYVVNDIEPSRDIVEEGLGRRLPDPKEAVPDAGDFYTRVAPWLRSVGMHATAELVLLQSDPKARFLAATPSGTTYEPEQFGHGPRGWPRSQAALLAMRDACRERSIPFVVLDHTLPVLRPLPTFCAQSAIPCEDSHFTAEELHQPIYNSAKDTHANARGNELLLQKLRRIAEQLPLPR